MLPIQAMVRALAFGFVVAMGLWSSSCSSDNSAPALSLVLDQQVVVGDTLRVIFVADDPDGDRLDFDVTGLPKTAQVTPRAANEAVLVWSPLITDTQPGGRRYEVEVTVDDSRGGSARQSIGVVVYPTFGIPAFTLPAGVVVNLGQQDDLELLVEVKDDDSTEVAIDMTEAPEGAKLQRADKKTAHFFWQPDDQQRKVAVHRAIFSARDESHAPVTHVLTIVLLNAEKQSGCDGAPPTVSHTPPADQTLFGPLELEATAADGQSQVQSFTLQWTRGDPAGTYAAAALERVSEGSAQWRAALADLGDVPDSGALVHYYMTATDNDDPTGVACDQSTRFPKTGFFTAAVYGPGASDTACVDDAAEPDDDPSGVPALKAGTYGGRRLCGNAVDYAGVDVPTGTTMVAAMTYATGQGRPSLALVDGSGIPRVEASETEPGRLQLTFDKADEGGLWLEIAGASGMRLSYTLELTIEAAPCEDDGAEPDSTPGEAKPLALGASLSQRVCPGDADFFRMNVASGQRVRFAAAFDHRYGDLDLELRAADGETVLATAASEKSVEEIVWDGDGGDVVVRVYGVEGATNAYTLTAEIAEASGCEPDGLGDNVTPEAAVALYQGVYEGFHACAGAPDWFAVDLNGGETLDVVVLRDVDSEPVSIDMYRDPSGAPIASGAPDGEGYATASAEALGPERLYYKVSVAGTAASYSLLQEVTDPPGACQPDRREPNGLGAAVPLTVGVHTWLRLCGDADIDAFAIEVDAFTNVIAFTNHAEGEAFTDIELLGPGGDTLYQATDLGDGAYLEEVLEQAGTYTLVVRPFDVPTTGLGYDVGLFLD